MPTRPPTPTTLAEIDAGWLGAVLGADVGTVTVTRIGDGEGFMGEIARVVLDPAAVAASEGALPASVIVKLPTGEPGARAFGEMMRVWEREYRFHVEVAAHGVVRVPRVFAAVAEPPCLVLEDLAPLEPGDHVAGATVPQAEAAIDVLARHHAHWFEHPMLASFGWMPGLDDPMVHSLAPTFAIGWPSFLERFGAELPARCLRWCEQFVADVPTWLAGYAHEPVTVTHGDFRLDNLFFPPGGAAGEPAVIDWQLAMRAPGQADLVYFCANNLTTELRRAHEDALIERYVAGLHAGGVPADAVTVASVRRGYAEGMLFYATSFAASLLTISPVNERGMALFEQLVRRTFAAVDDLDVGDRMGF